MCDVNGDDNEPILKQPGNVDSLLAQELNQMSLKEREAVYEEIHGVDLPVKESEELIIAKLQEINRELNKISDKPAYIESIQRDPTYVQSRKFLLSFLRTTRFDAEAAAKRLVRFMEWKRSLFGDHTLTRPIMLQDLDEDDLATLNSGVLQILSARDRTGRPVISDFEMLLPQRCYRRPENMVRNLVLYVYLGAGIPPSNLISALSIFQYLTLGKNIRFSGAVNSRR